MLKGDGQVCEETAYIGYYYVHTHHSHCEPDYLL
jgi:hypothetical protein